MFKKLPVVLSVLFMLMFSACSFFADGDLSEKKKTEEKIELSYLKLSKNVLKMKVGGIEYLSYSYSPSNVSFEPVLEYDHNKLEVANRSDGLVITALDEGQSELTISYGNKSSTCIVSISGFEVNYTKVVEPYIYSNTSILQMTPNTVEKVFCSLYGGDIADIDSYSWTVTDSSVCSIQPTGQYCMISAKNTGYTRIKVTHPKSTYPYYMGIYVFDDYTKSPYITTHDNILIMDAKDGDKTITVDIVNNKNIATKGDFTWSIQDVNGEAPVSIISNGNKAVVTPVKSGVCSIRVTHPEAQYPLDIMCRVITYVENVYIQPDSTMVTLSGDREMHITSELIGLKLGEYSIDGFSYSLENTDVAEITAQIGNEVYVKGKKNGSTKLIISHDKTVYDREVLLVSTNQISDAIDSTVYITTSQNYIKTKVGSDEIALDVMLKGAYEGDERNLVWSVKHNAADGVSNVINLETTDGIVNNSRAAYTSLAFGKAYITPLAEGTAVITISHPDILYPTEVLVKVLSKNSIIEEPLFFAGTGIVRILNSEETTYTVDLRGTNKSLNDEQNITWSCDDNRINIIPNGASAIIKAPPLGTGNTVSTITLTHPKVDSTKKIVIITADSEDVFSNIKTLYTDKSDYNLQIGESVSLYCNPVGFSDVTENYFSSFRWNVSDSTVINLEKDPYTDTVAHIKALKAGSTKVTGSIDGYSIVFNITVYPLGSIQKPYYLTGNGIVRILNSSETTYTVGLKGDDKTFLDEQNITWTCDNSNLSLVANATTAIIKAPPVGTGNTISTITVTHPKVESPKKITVITADTEQELNNIKLLYTDKAYYNLYIGDSAALYCNAVGFENVNDDYFNSFNWTVSDPSVISLEKNKILPTQANIKALKAGSVRVTGSIDGYSVVFNITVYPLGSINIEPDVYLTTTQNVIFIPNVDENKTVTIRGVNLEQIQYSEINWTAEDKSICSVIANGTSATIIAKALGETIIEVTHPDSQNTLKLYVKVGQQYVNKDLDPVIYISSADIITMLKDDQPQKVQATLVNNKDNQPNTFTFSIDNPAIATIASQYQTGIAYITPVASGQAELTIKNTLTELTKTVLICVGNTSDELAAFSYLTTDNNVVTIGEGNTRTINVYMKNTDDIVLDGYNWNSSDNNIVTINATGSSAVLQANSSGIARVTVTNSRCKYPLEIIVQIVDPVLANANPYIQLSSNILVVPTDGAYTNVTAELVGGKDSDNANFSWTPSVDRIVTLLSQNNMAKIKGIAKGQAIITVTHPKARDAAQLLVVCEEQKKNDCYISVPSSIINMKPTDSTQTITASLVNGSVSDKYNFVWSLDVYDIVDFQYSANVCTIRPLQAGTTTITVHHPKSDYDQKIIVTVSEYTTFQFPENSYTLSQGDVKFVSMQVPTTQMKTHIEYSVENENICSITGTKTVAQLTGIGKGTTTVTAKLVNNAGQVQATSEMLVYVKEKVTTEAYITSSSTIYTVAKGKSQTLTANITGSEITVTDQNDLQWQTSDVDIVKVTGISQDGFIKGKSIYLEAVKSGEAIITCSHPKASSSLQFYVVVPGSGEKLITLNKTYATITKGSTGTTLQANIENLESNDDYGNIIWTVLGPNGVDGTGVARVMGSGKQVQIYPVSPGEVTVYAQLPDSKSVAKCDITVEAGKSLVIESSAVRLSPTQTKTLSYTVSPPNAIITWTTSTNDGTWYFKDNGVDDKGKGSIEVEGRTDGGGGMLIGTTDGGATARLTVKVTWSYDFRIKGNTSFNIKPTETVKFSYQVTPPNAKIIADDPNVNVYYTIDVNKQSENDDYAIGEITLKPIKENSLQINCLIKAVNPANNDTVGSVSLNGMIKYPELNFTVKKNAGSGRFSAISDDRIILADGEKLDVLIDIAEKNVNGNIKSVTWQSVNNVTGFVKNLETGSTATGKIITLQHNYDYVEKFPFYRIQNLYVPYTIEDDSPVNWKTDVVWRVRENKYWNFGDYYDDFFGIVRKSNYIDNDSSPDSTNNDYWILLWHDGGGGTNNIDKNFSLNSNYILKEDVSYRNTSMSKYEFEHTAWLYCPGTPNINPGKDYNNTVSMENFDKGEKSRGTYGHGNSISIEPQVNKHTVIANIDYEYSKDETIKNEKLVGYLIVSFLHAGLEEKSTKNIPVYYVQYNCKNGGNHSTESEVN